MRLINVDTLEVEEFFDASIPRYAILSHTWGKDEVTFQELCWLKDYEKNQATYASLGSLILQLGQDLAEKASALRRRAGFDKIVQSARIAKEKGLQYVWVDTCCIDKTSSAELSEAINSMYQWYGAAGACFAFLSDVAHCKPGDGKSLGFEESRWFTRGWTLQELLAPADVVFLDRDWEYVASRKRDAPKISRITGIPVDVLHSPAEATNKSIAQRMSWASSRRTSRREDVAYCLLGLFGINMPLLYGEGDRAFIRLQQEIAREHSDQSLFAWGLDQEITGEGTIFAPSPGHFAGASEVKTAPKTSVPAFQLNNKGLEIALHLFQVHPAEKIVDTSGSRWFYHAMLESWVDGAKGEKYMICLPMFRVREGSWELRSGDEMIRAHSGPVKIPSSLILRGVPVEVVVLKEPPPPPPLPPLSRSCFFSVEATATHQRTPPDSIKGELELLLVETYPPPLQVERSTSGSLSFRCQVRYKGVYLLRFVSAANPERHFVVAVSPAELRWTRQSRGADNDRRPKRGITMLTDYRNSCPPASPVKYGAARMVGGRNIPLDPETMWNLHDFASLAAAFMDKNDARKPFWTFNELNKDNVDTDIERLGMDAHVVRDEGEDYFIIILEWFLRAGEPRLWTYEGRPSTS